MKRRTFLKTSAAISATTFLPDWEAFTKFNEMNNIGIQLFSLPKLLDQDFKGGIEMLSKMGYQQLEMYGPYPFSVEPAKERWKMLAPMLGFSGSGYFGYQPKEVRAILDDNGIKATSTHTDLETLETKMGALGEAASIMGFEYVGLPAIPDERRTSLDDYKKIADTFNKIGAAAKKEGIKFAYHNHGYGLQEVEGQIPLKIILDNTDPELVFFELDIYWTTAGGADPIAYLEAYPNRYPLMHLKDMKEKVRFAGDGGDAQEWMALFPFMTNVGSGVLDIEAIVAKGKENGVKNFYVEQDMVQGPEVALKASIDYLKKL